MRLLILRLLSLACLVGIAACSSNVVLDHSAGAPVYQYSGEKYGKVEVKWSDEVGADAVKVYRIKQMALDKAVINRLIANRLYDPAAANSMEVRINSFSFRNSFNAVMFGFMAGSDSLDGVVSLKAADGRALTHFDVSASYALGGSNGGNADTRMGWLSDKFGELTAQTILNKPQPGQDASR